MVWDSIVGIRIKTCVAYKMDPVQQISIQQKLLDRLSIQTSIMDTGTHTFCTIQSHAIYRLKNDLFHISLVIILRRLPYRSKTKKCVNMRQMMIIRMMRKLLFFNLFSVFLQLIDVKVQVGMIWRYQPIRQGWYDVVIQSMSV